MQHTHDNWQRKCDIVGNDTCDSDMDQTGNWDAEVVLTGSEIDFVSERLKHFLECFLTRIPSKCIFTNTHGTHRFATGFKDEYS